MYVCESCGKKSRSSNFCCLTCFGLTVSPESFEDFEVYLEEIIALRDQSSTPLGRWELHKAAIETLNSVRQQLDKTESLNPTSLREQNRWATSLGFVSRDNPGESKATNLGFVSYSSSALSTEAQFLLQELEAALSSDETAFGHMAQPGVCNYCQKRVPRDAIVCKKCFGPCISMASYDARDVYRDEMEGIGRALANQESPNFEKWQSAMNELLEYMKFEIDAQKSQESWHPPRVRSSQVFWFLALIASTLSYFSVFLTNNDRSLARANGMIAAGVVIFVFLCVFLWLFVRCNSCKKYCLAFNSRVGRDLVGTQEGTHTEYGLAATWTTLIDRRGRQIGSGFGYAAVPQRVSHTNNVYSDTHECPYCHELFTSRFIQRR
jgi:hypothetical protein